MDFAERAAVYFAGRADMHRRLAVECDGVAPTVAASRRRSADMLDEVVEDLRKYRAWKGLQGDGRRT